MSEMLISDFLVHWTSLHSQANAWILFNIVGALLLGMIVGYERSYHGRAAGMRTYGMVCMGSAAVTVIIGYPHFWFDGQMALAAGTDVTRVIQGILTGVGFLGAGVIMKEGRNISGLTTAASIWASSAIGIMFGAGFYLAAIMLTFIVAATMIWGGYIESVLPSRQTLELALSFQASYKVDGQEIRRLFHEQGFQIAESTIHISQQHNHQQWRLILIAHKTGAVTIAEVAGFLQSWPFLTAYQVGFARN